HADAKVAGVVVASADPKISKSGITITKAVPGYKTGTNSFYSDPNSDILHIHHDPADPNPTLPLSLQLLYRPANDPTLDPFPEQTFSSNLNGAAPPSQGVVRDNAGYTPAELGSFFDVFYSVDASFQGLDGGGIFRTSPLLQGTITFHPDGTIATTGGFNG